MKSGQVYSIFMYGFTSYADMQGKIVVVKFLEVLDSTFSEIIVFLGSVVL